MATFPRSLSDAGDRGSEDVVGLPADSIHSGDVSDNLRHLLPIVCVADGTCSTSKRVRYLNDLAKVIKHVGHVIEPNYPVERIIESARLSLLSAVKEVRAGALRVLRYLLTSWEAFRVMQKHCVELLVARSLDAPPNREIERLQAVRFVRQALTLSPLDFPQCLLTPLVSIVMYDAEQQDNLTWASIATLCELALHNPELAAQVGAINALVCGLLKCQTFRITEAVILTLSHLLNSPSSRKYISSQFDIESLLAPITDLQYSPLINDNTRAGSSAARQISLRVEASKMALISLLKTWPGIFCLCNPRNLGMTSLLNMLPLAMPTVQREILDVLYGVFQLKVPEWTSSYYDAIISIDPTQPKTEWGLSEGFVAEEGRDLLPPKAVDRTNLIDCYQALVLAALVEEDLLEVLIETVRKSEREVVVMASILLGQLLHLTNAILPTGYFSNAHCLPKLVEFALDFETMADMERIRASEVISCLDRVHQLKKQSVQPSSQYLKLILDQSGYYFTKKTKEELQNIPAELDEAMVSSLIKDTNVLATKEYRNWQWGPLLALLEHPGIKITQINEDALFAKFIKRLYNFFKPSNHHYSVILYSEANSRRYSSVGQKLVKYLCRAEEGRTGYLFELVLDVVNELSQVTAASKLTADVFTHTSVAHKLSRDYFLFLGTVSFYRPTVLEQCKAYGALLDICNYQNRCDLMKLMVSSLDYAHDHASQVILSKLLTSTDKEMRLYATRHLRVLLRAKMPFFNSWGLELLVTQLYDIDKEVAIEALDILDEACEGDNFLKALVLQHPQLLHLGEKGAALQTRFFSVKRGFALMSRLGYLESVLEKWNRSYNKLYVYIVEEKLAESLTTFQHTQAKDFIRRSNTSVTNPKAFVPVHLYGQLAQLDEGCQLLDKEKYVVELAECVRAALQSPPCCDILEVKAALWALGHIGSSLAGLDLLHEEDVIVDLVQLAETCDILSIRGTAYYALCLISKTSRGAELLLELNWSTVCHTLGEKWPLAVPQGMIPGDSVFASPASTPGKGPLSSLGSLQGARSVRSATSAPAPYQAGTIPRTAVRGTSINQRRKQRGTFSTSSEMEPATPKSPPLRDIRRNVSMEAPSHASRFRSSYGINSRKAQSLNKTRPNEFPVSLIAVHQQSSLRQKNSRPPSTADMTSYFRSSSVSSQFPLRQSFSFTNAPYLGVCLPMDIPKMFEFADPPYRGFAARFTSAPDFSKDVLPHDRFKCLECSISLIKAHHQSQGDVSGSTEDLGYAGSHLFKVDSSNSLSPETRSRSHTTDSVASGESSTPNTPQSLLLGQDNSKSSGSAVDVDSPRDGEQKEAVSGAQRSPLARLKRVTSEGPDDIVQKPDSGSSSSSKLDDGSKLACDSSSSSRSGEGPDSGSKLEEKGDHSSGGTEAELPRSDGHDKGITEEEEEVKDHQEVLINVIKASVPAEAKDQATKSSGSSTGTGGSKGKGVAGSGGGGGSSGKGRGGGKGKDMAETGSLSSTSQSSLSGADHLPRLHCAYLEVVFSLSSDVSLRKNTTTLNMLAQKYPNLSQDVCLYSKVMDLLSSYHFKLNTRRFIQAKFEKLNFATIFAAKPQLDDDFSEEDFLSSACSSRRGSFCSLDFHSADNSGASPSSGNVGVKLHRRRSSTSDASKFREKLQSLSKSMEKQENLVAESPRERDSEGEEEEADENIQEGGEQQGAEVEKRGTVKFVEGADLDGAGSSPRKDGSGSQNGETYAQTDNRHSKEETAAAKVGVPELRKILNYPEKARESSASSVYNVGFDL